MTRLYIGIQYQPQPDSEKELNPDILHAALSHLFLTTRAFIAKHNVAQLTYYVLGDASFQKYVLMQAESARISMEPLQDINALAISEDDLQEALNGEEPIKVLAYYYIGDPLFSFGADTTTVDLGARFSLLLQDPIEPTPEGDANRVFRATLKEVKRGEDKPGSPYADLGYNPVRWTWALRTTSLRTRPPVRTALNAHEDTKMKTLETSARVTKAQTAAEEQDKKDRGVFGNAYDHAKALISQGFKHKGTAKTGLGMAHNFSHENGDTATVRPYSVPNIRKGDAGSVGHMVEHYKNGSDTSAKLYAASDVTKHFGEKPVAKAPVKVLTTNVRLGQMPDKMPKSTVSGRLVEGGTIRYFKDGQAHRDGDNPSYISEDEVRYEKNGVPHRKNGPAISTKLDDGSIMHKHFWKGNLHNAQDPEAPAVYNRKTGFQAHYQHGKLHRDDDSKGNPLPAVTYPHQLDETGHKVPGTMQAMGFYKEGKKIRGKTLTQDYMDANHGRRSDYIQDGNIGDEESSVEESAPAEVSAHEVASSFGWEKHPDANEKGTHTYSHAGPDEHGSLKVHASGSWEHDHSRFPNQGHNGASLRGHLSAYHSDDYEGEEESGVQTPCHKVVRSHGWLQSGGNKNTTQFQHPKHELIGHVISADNNNNWAHHENGNLVSHGSDHDTLDSHLAQFHTGGVNHVG